MAEQNGPTHPQGNPKPPDAFERYPDSDMTRPRRLRNGEDGLTYPIDGTDQDTGQTSSQPTPDTPNDG